MICALVAHRNAFRCKICPPDFNQNLYVCKQNLVKLFRVKFHKNLFRDPPFNLSNNISVNMI